MLASDQNFRGSVDNSARVILRAVTFPVSSESETGAAFPVATVAVVARWIESPGSTDLTAFAEDGTVQFLLENTGIHIPDLEIPKLFDAFYRVEHSRNKKTGGSGLGLYIVKTILEQHQAEYSITNTERGVLFTIQF